MGIDSGPHDLEQVRVVFRPGGDAVLKPVTPGFYEALGAFRGHILV